MAGIGRGGQLTYGGQAGPVGDRQVAFREGVQHAVAQGYEDFHRSVKGSCEPVLMAEKYPRKAWRGVAGIMAIR